MKFYYINLNKSTDRNKNMLSFFDNLSKIRENINFERIEGFDGSKENIDDYLTVFKFEDLKSAYYINKNVSHHGVKLKKGEFGCLYSHLKAIYNFSQTNEDVAIICEDDLDNNIIYKSEYFNSKLDSIIENIDEYGIIMISCVGHNKTISNILNNNNSNSKELYKFIPYYFYGTGSYMINKKTANKIVNSCLKFENGKMLLDIHETKVSLVADNFIYSFSNTHVYLPSLFFTRKNNDSLINSNLNKQYISQQIMKKYIQKHKLQYLNDTIVIKKKKVSKNRGLSNNLLIKIMSR
jgi:GR25 family glycosyltransferase involved in LPS biosynthesis